MKSEAVDLHAHVVEKLTRVLGAARAGHVLASVLAQLALQRLETLDDVQRFAEELKRRQGFDATVGAMLLVDVMIFKLKVSSARPH